MARTQHSKLIDKVGTSSSPVSEVNTEQVNNVFYVMPSEGKSGINTAINDASAGDRIQLFAGTYSGSETVTIDKKEITLAGIGWGTKIEQSAGGEDQIKVSGDLKDVKIQDLAIHGNGNKDGKGVFYSSSSGSYVAHFTVENVLVYEVDTAFYLDGCSDSQVVDCVSDTFVGSDNGCDVGVHWINCAGISVMGGYQRHAGTGIYGDGSGAQGATNENTIDGVQLAIPRLYGVRLNNVFNTEVSNVQIENVQGSQYGIYIEDSDSVTVAGNTLHDVSGYGIYIAPGTETSHSITVTGNSITDMAYGIYAEANTAGDDLDLTITGNSIWDMVEDGIILAGEQGENVTISGNALYNCGIQVGNNKDVAVVGNAIKKSDDWGIYVRGENVVVLGNVLENISNNGIAVVGYDYSSVSIIGNSFRNTNTSNSASTGDIKADPNVASPNMVITDNTHVVGASGNPKFGIGIANLNAEDTKIDNNQFDGGYPTKISDSGTRTTVNKTATESANAEEPQQSWPTGTIVDFTDSGDGSGTGVYYLAKDGAWMQLS